MINMERETQEREGARGQKQSSLAGNRISARSKSEESAHAQSSREKTKEGRREGGSSERLGRGSDKLARKH